MYECPHCLWKWKRDYNYRIGKEGLVYLNTISEKNPDFIYPIFKEEYEDSKGVLHWREVHYCPNCRWEFEYDLDEVTAESLK